jgi:hypothetical protein
VVGYYTNVLLEPALVDATPIEQSGNTVLWRVPGGLSAPVSAASCPETPSENSTSK